MLFLYPSCSIIHVFPWLLMTISSLHYASVMLLSSCWATIPLIDGSLFSASEDHFNEDFFFILIHMWWKFSFALIQILFNTAIILDRTWLLCGRGMGKNVLGSDGKEYSYNEINSLLNFNNNNVQTVSEIVPWVKLADMTENINQNLGISPISWPYVWMSNFST